MTCLVSASSSSVHLMVLLTRRFRLRVGATRNRRQTIPVLVRVLPRPPHVPRYRLVEDDVGFDEMQHLGGGPACKDVQISKCARIDRPSVNQAPSGVVPTRNWTPAVCDRTESIHHSAGICTWGGPGICVRCGCRTRCTGGLGGDTVPRGRTCAPPVRHPRSILVTVPHTVDVGPFKKRRVSREIHVLLDGPRIVMAVEVDTPMRLDRLDQTNAAISWRAAGSGHWMDLQQTCDLPLSLACSRSSGVRHHSILAHDAFA